VHIIVVCPKCQTRYQIDPAFRGVRMRCPNNDCRAVFDAREVTDSPPPPAANRPTDGPRPRSGGTPQWSGNVGEVVPVLPAETAKPATEAPSWRNAPPPRRPDAPNTAPPAAAPPPQRATNPVHGDWRQEPPPRPGSAGVVPPPPPRAKGVAPPPRPGGAVPGRASSRPEAAPPPDEVLDEVVPEVPSWEQAPPPRRGAGAVEEEPAEVVAPAEEAHEEYHHPARKRGLRNLLFIGGFVLVILCVGGGGIGIAIHMVQGTESSLAAQARAAYAGGQYGEAASKFKQLGKQFGDSPDAKEYHFMEDLAALRAQLAAVIASPEATLEQVNGFLKDYGADPLLKEHARDFGPDFIQWLAARGEAAGDDQKGAQAFLKKAQETLQYAQQVVPEAFTPEELATIERKFHKAVVETIKKDELKELVTSIQGLQSSPENVKIAKRKIADLARSQPGVPDNADVKAAEDKLYAGLIDRVRYVEGADVPRGRARTEDFEPSMVVNQLVQGVPPEQKPNDPVLLALVRGVLYALAQSNGEVIWAMRVGIDTATLPVRVPAAGSRPEMVLALSADTLTLTALEAATSRQLWTYRLSAPCLGQPVVVGLRAYVPTYDGIVHEVELAKGQPLGHYELGQHLTLGGTRQERTDLVYFPADDQCVYVLDVRNKHCVGVLYSGHPSGSLRSPPIVVNPGGGADGYVILTETDGLEATSLRAFPLPIQGVQRLPPEVQTPSTPGWPWFPPYYDPEKLVLVTDAGAVGLFGIKQERTQDGALFPLVREPYRVALPAGSDPSHLGRAQVVACQDDALWVLAHGGLQKLNLIMSPAKGPQLAVDPLWKQPLPLGSPLHRSQVEPNGPGSTLFLVTQAPNGRGCLATAVDSATKKVLWQRELGLVAQGPPQPLGKDLLALDQDGGVFAFDPSRPTRSDEQWQSGGRGLAKPLADNPNFPPSLHVAADGSAAYELACPGKGTQLVVRRFPLEASGRVAPPQDQDEKTVDLPAAPAGAAALRGGNLLLPLEDGTVFRVHLPDCPPGTTGPEWRPARANAGLRCHVVWVNGDEFLTTDGGHGITHWRWPPGKSPTALPLDKAEKDPTAEVRRSIVSAPAVLPSKDELRACVADASGTLTLLHGEGLEEAQHWDLGGKITAGPFVRGDHVGCVVDGDRLVWLDPAKKDPLWEYRNAGGEPVVGEPQLVEELLVVAHQSGRFVGLDPTTGRPHGPGFTLQASAAPAVSPTAFGNGRAFAPLTDGTVLLLSLQHLRDPFGEFPVVW
jgi:hypothetical protein